MDHHKKNILDSLNKKGTGYTTPKGYFEGFEERLIVDFNEDTQIKMEIKSEEESDHHKRLVPDLIGKNHGFKVPDQYFEKDFSIEKLSGKQKIISLEGKSTKKWLSLAVAASFLLFFGVKFYTAPDKPLEFADLEENEIENWIDADLISFNTYEVAEAFYDVELENDMYSDEEVADYLDQIDIEQLILDN